MLIGLPWAGRTSKVVVDSTNSSVILTDWSGLCVVVRRIDRDAELLAPAWSLALTIDNTSASSDIPSSSVACPFIMAIRLITCVRGKWHPARDDNGEDTSDRNL